MGLDRKLVAKYENGFSADTKGLIEMLKSQFEKPVVCFRELVQNSIDENAGKISLQFNYDKNKEILAISVKDDGIGMDYEKIKRYLTIFDSTKENLRDKIGKFGIGKISAFALNPEQLVIETGNGVKGHKVVIDRNLSGKIMEVKPVKGTNVIILKKVGVEDAQELASSITEYIEDSCEYSPIPIIVDSKEKIGGKWHLDAEHQISFNFKTRSGYGVKGISGVISKNESKFLAIKGGLKLGEVEYPFSIGHSKWRIRGLETIVDSFGFNHPLSRNKVYEDDSFLEIIEHILKEPLKELAENCSSKLKKSSYIYEKNNIKAFLLGYMNVFSEDKKAWGLLPKNLMDAELFRTVDDGMISFNEIEKAHKKSKFIYISRTQEGVDEARYFKNKNIPVIELDYDYYYVLNILKERFGSLVPVDATTTVMEYGYRTKSENERRYISLLKDLFSYDDSIHQTSNESFNDEKDSESEETGKFFKNDIDLADIKGAKFAYFYTIDGKPAKWKVLDIANNYISLNILNDYVHSMIELSSKNPKLSKFYTLCEIVKNKKIFPKVSAKDAENFIIEKMKDYVR